MSSVEQIKIKWQLINDKFSDMSLRERGLLAGTVFVALLVIWLQFVFSPWEAESKKQKVALTAVQSEQLALANALAELEARLQQDPNKALKLEQKQLNAALDELTQTIEGTLSGLVAPEKMVDVLRSVLSQVQGLTLVSLHNLPVEPVKFESVSVNEKNASEAQRENRGAAESALFSHGLELVVEGQFFDVLAYVKKLEAVPGIYWQMLDYEVSSYPKAKVTLRVSTLSLEKNWLGV